MQDRIVHSTNTGTSLVVHTSTSGVGLIPDQGSMIPHATQCGQTKIKKNNNNKQISTEQPYRQGVKVNMKIGQGTGPLLMIFFSTQQIKIFLNYQGTRYEVIKKNTDKVAEQINEGRHHLWLYMSVGSGFGVIQLKCSYERVR